MMRRYLSLCCNEPENVVLSQVVEYLHALERHNLLFQLCFLLHGGHYLKRYRGAYRQFEQIATGLLSRPIKFYPSPMKGRPAGQLLALALLRQILGWPSAKHVNIVHSRGLACSYLLSRVKPGRADVKFIYDVRGDYLAEFEYLRRQDDEERTSDRNRSRLIAHERQAANAADHIFCVSSVLKNRLVERHDLPSDKITIVPCCADEARFKFDAAMRSQVRAGIGIGNRFALVYSGGLQQWHCADRLFETMALIAARNQETFFIILSPHETKAEDLAVRTLPAGRFFVKNAGADEVAHYLSAADMGILLRDRDPLNEVAAPTKFAEYLLSGLPVMITEGIGDYSRFVKDHSAGLVLDDDCNALALLEQFRVFIANETRSARMARSALGVKHFAKDRVIETMRDIYSNL